MSTATAEPPTTTDDAQTVRWATDVNVGPGAESCDDPASCTDSDHFHAWLRVVNPFVRDDIREQAMAARARRLRQFRDSESNSSLILDGELDELRAEAERDGSTEGLIDRVLLKDWGRRHLEAMREAGEEEDFQHIEADRKRFAELSERSDDERPADEYRELDKTIVAYGERVEELRKVAEAPVRESLADKTIDELLAIVREDRIAAEGNSAFFDAWVRANVVAGTYKPASDGKRPTQRMFQSNDDLAALNTEEATALRQAFVDLEAQFQDGLGNG